jgi:hypothetical protein
LLYKEVSTARVTSSSCTSKLRSEECGQVNLGLADFCLGQYMMSIGHVDWTEEVSPTGLFQYYPQQTTSLEHFHIFQELYVNLFSIYFKNNSPYYEVIFAQFLKLAPNM